jgi:hypothetical protein
MNTNQDTLALQLLKAKQTFTFKACEMNEIRHQVKLAKKNLAAATAPSSQRRHQATNPSPAPSIKSMTLEAFNAMTPHKRMSFIKEGGKIK